MGLVTAVNLLLALSVSYLGFKDGWSFEEVLASLYLWGAVAYPYTRRSWPRTAAGVARGLSLATLLVALALIPYFYFQKGLVGPQYLLLLFLAFPTAGYWSEATEALLARFFRGRRVLAPGGAGERVEVSRPVEEAKDPPLEKVEAQVKARVVGQDEAIGAVFRGLKRKAAGLTRPGKPFSALLLGPTGTGKTEFAKALAEATGRPLVRYDMNQYGQDHTVAGLVGSPPGYIGSEEPGKLYRDLVAHPRGVFLFDEMEKAHPRVFDPLIQLLDEGRFQELSRSLVAVAPEAILLFTSNLMAEEAFYGGGLGENLRERLVQKGLRPEWVNRLDVIAAFKPFSGEALERLAAKVVRDYVEGWARRAGVREARVDEGVVPLILGRVDTRFGARDLQRAVEELVADPLAEAYLRAGGKARRVEVLRRGNEIVVVLE
jgi:ATP-dependent Clp protease ATP-binding subunit ClpB